MHTIAAYALRDIAEIAALGAFLIMIALVRPRGWLVTASPDPSGPSAAVTLTRRLASPGGRRESCPQPLPCPCRPARRLLRQPAHGLVCHRKPSVSCICTCTAPIRCARGRSPSRRWPSSPKPTPCRRLAITDTNNLFGALEFSEKLAKSGVQPIIGAQTTVDFGDAAPSFLRGVERDNARAPIVLLAQNEAGYRNLMRLVSALWLDPTDGDEPHVPFAALAGARGPHRADRRSRRADRPGLRAGLGDLAESRLERLAEVFGSRLYVEIQRHGLEAERAVEPELIALADRLGLPLVASNEPYFAGPCRL